MKYNYLTAIEKFKKDDGRWYWHCLCDCGKYCDIRVDRFKPDGTKSCGCKSHGKGAIKIKTDLVGQKFGRLTVIEDSGQRNNQTILWKCVCECGNECLVRTNSLKSGNTQSCGCLQKENTSNAHKIDISNQRFGKLIALYPTDKKSGGMIKWYCKCDCGNYTVTSNRNLRIGATISCGCVHSKGESIIANILLNNNIKFETQKTFSDCILPTGGLAKFDFYIIDKNILIEYDGIQHFKYIENTNGWNNKENFEKTQIRDKYKNEWCIKNNIMLIRIRYDEDILNKLQEYKIIGEDF